MPFILKKCCCGGTHDGGLCCNGCGAEFNAGTTVNETMCSDAGGTWITGEQLYDYQTSNPTKLPCCEYDPENAPWISSPPVCSDCQNKSYAEMAAVGCSPISIHSYAGVRRWKKLETNQTSFYLIVKEKEIDYLRIVQYGENGYFCNCSICSTITQNTKYERSYVGFYAGYNSIFSYDFTCTTSNGYGISIPWTLALAESAISTLVTTNTSHGQYSSNSGQYYQTTQNINYSSGGGNTCTESCGCIYLINTPYIFQNDYELVCSCSGTGCTNLSVHEYQNQPLSNSVKLIGSDNAISPTHSFAAACHNECCDCGFGIGTRGEICNEPWGCCRSRYSLSSGESCEITRRNTCNVGRGNHPFGGVGAMYTTFTPLGTGEKTDYTCDGCTSVYVGLCVYTGKNQDPPTYTKTCTASITATAASAIVDVYPPDPDVWEYLIVPENSCSECPLNPPSVEMDKWCIKDSEGHVLECSSVATSIDYYATRLQYWDLYLYNNAIANGINPPCVTTVATFGNQLPSCASCVDTSASTPVKKCCIQDLQGDSYYCLNSTYCSCRNYQVLADAQIKLLDPYDAATMKWETPLNCATECTHYTGACCLVLSDGSLYECTDGKDFAECQARAAAVNELLNLPYPDGDFVTWQWLKGIACSTNPCI